MTMLVAIDSSTEIASLALARDGRLLAETTWRSGQNHTVQLAPNLTALLKLVGAETKDCGGIIVAKGPGSFNGLRVGVSFAKGLAYALAVPIVGIGTLEAAAYQYADTGLPVCVVYSAGRDEVATATYVKRDGVWQETAVPHITTLEQLAARITERTLFCGEHMVQAGPGLQLLLGGKAVIASATTDMRRAAYLLELGMKRLDAGDVDDAATLQPVYLRRPPITVAKKK